ncbi:MAG: type II toxin-antitoxin system HicB family antitoxin [Patescibacteria group bacterium]|nr:type II toxin-antitoxin system HicB family antitoxin [Patescibacteria group bacterium]
MQNNLSSCGFSVYSKRMKTGYQITVPVSFLKEGKRYVAYSPALDISTSGKTLKETKKRFAEMVDIFIEEAKEMGTLDAVLRDLGWAKSKRVWQPPVLVAQEDSFVRMPA